MSMAFESELSSGPTPCDARHTSHVTRHTMLRRHPRVTCDVGGGTPFVSCGITHTPGTSMPTPVQPPRGPTAPRGPAPPPRGPTPPRAGAPPRGMGGPAKPVPPKPRPLPKLPAWLERARRMILAPTQEWAAVAGEFTSVGPIYARFLLPMAAIGPVATTVGALVSGERSSLFTLGDTYPVFRMDALTSGVLEYGLNLLAVWVL